MINPETFPSVVMDLVEGVIAAQVVQATDCTLDRALKAVRVQMIGMASEPVSPRSTAEAVLMCIREIEEE